VMAVLAPKTKAYHSIWIDNVQLKLERRGEQDFVVRSTGRLICRANSRRALCCRRWNDMRLFTTISASSPSSRTTSRGLQPLAVAAWAGSHGNRGDVPPPRGCDWLFSEAKVVEVAKAVLTIHRDFGESR